MKLGQAKEKNEDIFSQNQDKNEENSQSNLAADHATSQSGRIPNWIQGSEDLIFFQMSQPIRPSIRPETDRICGWILQKF